LAWRELPPTEIPISVLEEQPRRYAGRHHRRNQKSAWQLRGQNAGQFLFRAEHAKRAPLRAGCISAWERLGDVSIYRQPTSRPGPKMAKRSGTLRGNLEACRPTLSCCGHPAPQAPTVSGKQIARQCNPKRPATARTNPRTQRRFFDLLTRSGAARG